MSAAKAAVLISSGAVMTAIFGGWDGAMSTLCVFILMDYLAGIVLAGVFRRSKHTAGGLDSRAGLMGLFRKAGMMLVVIVAVRLDMLCDLDGVLRMGTIYALIANDALSIIENLGLMGVPLPETLRAAIERLRNRDPRQVSPSEQSEQITPSSEDESSGSDAP